MENFAPVTAQRISPLENPNWDALLASRPDFSFFHGAAWAKVLTDTYGFKPASFFTGKAGAIESLLPLMEVDSWLTGRRGVALPFTDECAPLCADSASCQRLFQAAVGLGKSRGWKYIECRGGRQFFGDAPASLSFYGHSLDLTADESRMFETMEGSARRAVRKAEKDGVTVEVSQSQEAVRTFYRLQCRTRKRHGLPPQPFAFFVNIHRQVLSQNLGMVAVASHHGNAVAASIYFYLGGRAIYKFGASDAAWLHLRANNLVMWEAVKWLSRNGVNRLHLGRTSMANAGLRRFKLNLGAHEEQIEYVKYDLRQGRFVTETDGVSGWHNAVFRALPGFLSRMAGGLLYKHWA